MGSGSSTSASEVAVLPQSTAIRVDVRPAGRGGPAVEERHPGRDRLRDLRRLGVRRQRQRPGRRPGRLRGGGERAPPRTRSTSNGAAVFAASGITDIGGWYAGRHCRPGKSALTSERIDLAGGEHVVDPGLARGHRLERQVRQLLIGGLPHLVELTGLDWPVAADLSVLRGPHAAARGLCRGLLPGRGPDRDQRGPRRPHDPPRGVPRLVQRRSCSTAAGSTRASPTRMRPRTLEPWAAAAGRRTR